MKTLPWLALNWLVLLIFLVGSVVAIPGSKTKGGAAPASANTVELNEGYRATKESIGSLITVIGCSSTIPTNCWAVEENKLVYVKDATTKYSGSDLDDSTKAANFWKEGVEKDDYGNLKVKSDSVTTYYSKDGLAKIQNLPEGTEVAGSVSSLGGKPVVPVKVQGEEQVWVSGVTLDPRTYELLKDANPKEITVNAQTKVISWDVPAGIGRSTIANSITQKTENNGLTTTEIKFGAETRTSYIFAGQTFTADEGWTESNGKLTNSLENRELTFAKDTTTQTLTLTDKNTLTKEATITTYLPDNKHRQVEKKNKDDKTESFELRDAEGHLLGEMIDDGDKKKEKPSEEDFKYYDPSVGIFTGRLTAVCYTGCTGNPGGDTNTIWVTNDGACQGIKTDCYNTAGGQIKSKWDTEDEVCKTKNSDKCNAIFSKEADSFWLGETTPQQVIGDILQWRPGWESLSLWWLPEETRAWQKLARETFDKYLAAEYIVPRKVCDYDETHKTKRPGESATFIEVAPGVVQFVGSIQAEKTPNAGPILCERNTEEDADEDEQFICGQKQVCVDNTFCYKDSDEDGEPDPDAEQPLPGFFYKITWGVTAPQDESFTPYVDENGVAVKFNLKIFGERELFLYPKEGAGSKTTLQLKNGESDQDTIVAYSPYNYQKVCILFGAPSKDLSGEEVQEICTNFVPSTAGQIEWEEADRPGSAAGERSVKVNDVGRAQI